MGMSDSHPSVIHSYEPMTLSHSTLGLVTPSHSTLVLNDSSLGEMTLHGISELPGIHCSYPSCQYTI